MQEFPLSLLRTGETAIVRKIAGHHGITCPDRSWRKRRARGMGGGHRVMGRLASLGFTPGVEVTMVQNYGRGPLIVEVRGTQVALGRREASRVWVNSEAP